jgi:ABC-type lipoprotein export system ATPase subunit
MSRSKATQSRIGFVEQTDIVINSLTVFEFLCYTAKLRLPKEKSDADRRTRVSSLIETMRLTKCCHTEIGEISGGEKKRTAICNELLSDPKVLMLDEPTSGLDSSIALTVMSSLKALTLARPELTIILSIHQPSSQIFALFDRLLLMDTGRVVFHDEARAASQFFTDSGLVAPPGWSVPDHIMDVLVNKKLPPLSFSLSRAAESPDKVGIVTETESPSRRPAMIHTTIGRGMPNADVKATHTDTPETHNRGMPNANVEGLELALSINLSEKVASSNLSEKEAGRNLYPTRVSAPFRESEIPPHRKVSGDRRETTDSSGYRRGTSDPANPDNPDNPNLPLYALGWCDQVLTLGRRTFYSSKKHVFTWLLLSQFLLLALCNGLIWFGLGSDEADILSRVSYTFWVSGTWTFFPVLESLMVFHTDHELVAKELTNHAYSLSAHFVSRALVNMALQFHWPLLMLSVHHPMAGLAYSPLAFCRVYGLTVLCCLANTSIGLCIGAWVSARHVMVVAIVAISLTFGFAGFLVPLDRMLPGLRGFNVLSVQKYSFQGMLVLVFNPDQTFACDINNNSSSSSSSSNTTTQGEGLAESCMIDYAQVMSEWQIPTDCMARAVAALVLFFVLFRVLAWAGLYVRYRGATASASS